jgi:hypothetical protein
MSLFFTQWRKMEKNGLKANREKHQQLRGWQKE